MALIPCPECKHQISDKAETCPQCGIKTEYYRALRKKGALIKLLIIIAALLSIFILNMIDRFF